MALSLDSETLKGPDFFTCERFSTRMLKRRCMEMQAKLLESGKRFSTGGEAVSLAALDRCRGCRQGEEMRKELQADLRKVKVPRREHKQGGRKKYNFEEAAWDHGFGDEKQMFTWLLKEWSLKAVGDLLGCSGATVASKRDEYGIPKRRPGFYGRSMKMETAQTVKKASIVERPIGAERSSKRNAESGEADGKVVTLDFGKYPNLWAKLEAAAHRRGLSPGVTVMMFVAELLMTED